MINYSLGNSPLSFVLPTKFIFVSLTSLPIEGGSMPSLQVPESIFVIPSGNLGITTLQQVPIFAILGGN